MEFHESMHRIFSGYSSAYGTYESGEKSYTSGKIEIRSSARTIKAKVTDAVWERHIRGQHPLGIIPINEKNMCRWAAIDVDRYDINHLEIAQRIQDRKLPLLVCRSKSGGAHIFAFFSDWEPAAAVQSVMRGVGAFLGYGGSEVFPKQASVLYEKGDMGSWLNMPYFGNERLAVKPTGAQYSLSEFLNAATTNLTTVADLYAIIGEAKTHNSPEFKDGPPCLQHLAAIGFGEGMRNNGLVALATYAKKKYESNWRTKVQEYNTQFMSPPLDPEEVMAIVASVKKKDYNYRCKDTPICDYCNSAVCITRRYGVGTGGDYPVITGLSMVDTDPPLWFLDVNGRRLEMYTDVLTNYRLFNKLCMEKLQKVFPPMKADTWSKIVANAMETVTKLESSPEVGIQGQFYEILRDFIRDKRQPKAKSVFLGRVWFDEGKSRYVFRLRDLAENCQRAKFTDYNRAQMAERIRGIGGGRENSNIEGDGVSLYWIPAGFVSIPELENPPIEDPPL